MEALLSCLRSCAGGVGVDEPSAAAADEPAGAPANGARRPHPPPPHPPHPPPLPEVMGLKFSGANNYFLVQRAACPSTRPEVEATLDAAVALKIQARARGPSFYTLNVGLGAGGGPPE